VAQLCVNVAPFANQIRPGQVAGFAILVWSSGRPSGPASVSIRGSSAFDTTSPSFNGCRGGSACSVGDLSQSRAEELTASSNVGSEALGGERLGLTATVSARGAYSGSASATIAVITPSASDPSGLLSDTALELGSAGGDYPPLLNLPGVTPVNPTSLFPTVSPGGKGLRSGHRPKHIDAVNTAAVVPLGPLTLGGQLIGLAVLVGALALAFIRFSLRTPRPSSGQSKTP